MALTETERRPVPPRRRTAYLWVGVAVVGAVGIGVYGWHHTDWPREAVYMAAIFTLAGILWATEALPLFATALLTIALQIVLLTNPGGWKGLGFESGSSPGFRDILNAAADPTILLFFGGFLLARAAVKEGVDRAMSSMLLRPFGVKPAMVTMGLMVVTALFSMWMSNTATATMMLTLLAPLLAQTPRKDPFRKLLVLAVPFSANIGGLGTPIASPPNAVAMGFLSKAGHTVSFLEWMLVALPLMFLLLLGTWGLLWLMYRPQVAVLNLQPPVVPLTRRGWFVVAVFGVTVLLWMTDQLHGLPASIVALLPAVAFTVTRILDHKDVNSLEWNILILIAGGVALGAGMQMTGLDKILLDTLPKGEDGAFMMLLAALVGITVVLGIFMSNTATANLVLPVGIASATAAGGDYPVQAGLCIALAASATMVLPISTPPNALAYGTGEVSTWDMARAGIIVTLAGGAAVLFLTGVLLRLWDVGS